MKKIKLFFSLAIIALTLLNSAAAADFIPVEVSSVTGLCDGSAPIILGTFVIVGGYLFGKYYKGLSSPQAIDDIENQKMKLFQRKYFEIRQATLEECIALYKKGMTWQRKAKGWFSEELRERAFVIVVDYLYKVISAAHENEEFAEAIADKFLKVRRLCSHAMTHTKQYNRDEDRFDIIYKNDFGNDERIGLCKAIREDILYVISCYKDNKDAHWPPRVAFFWEYHLPSYQNELGL